jgi:hypothetical protein
VLAFKSLVVWYAEIHKNRLSIGMPAAQKRRQMCVRFKAAAKISFPVLQGAGGLF